MSQKNARIREHLKGACDFQWTKNRFKFSNLEIKIDHDSPIQGVEYPEFVSVSIWNPETNTDMRFSVPVESVVFIESAL